MKFLKKCLLPLILAMSFIMCISFSACDNDEAELVTRQANCASAGSWDYVSSRLYSFTIHKGLNIQYKYNDAEIEVGNVSNDGILFVGEPGYNWDAVNFNYDKLPYYWGEHLGYRAADHDTLPLKYTGNPLFLWVTKTPWWELPHDGSKVFEDYVTFVARIDGHIVGYSVVYIKNDCTEGTSKILADVTFPKVDGEYQKISDKRVKAEIQKIIDGNTLKLSDIY